MPPKRENETHNPINDVRTTVGYVSAVIKNIELCANVIENLPIKAKMVTNLGISFKRNENFKTCCLIIFIAKIILLFGTNWIHISEIPAK